MQAALTTSQNFKDGLEVAIKALTELKKQLDKVPPVSRNLIELRNQAQQFKVTGLTLQELQLKMVLLLDALFILLEFLC